VQVFIAPTCAYSPIMARTAHKMGLVSPRIKADVIEVTEFATLMQRYGIRATPLTIINDSIVLTGAIEESAFIQAVSRAAEGKPLTAAETRPGPATPLQSPNQQQPRTLTSGSGLIIPR